MTIPESTYDDVARSAHLSSGQIVHGFHKSSHCKNDHCPVHNPSNHEYRDYALVFSFERFIFERIISTVDDQVTTVPDPDDYTLNLHDGNLVYRNSVRCNHCGDEIVSAYRHDFVTCSCEAVFVDGGSTYRRIGGSPADYTDTAILIQNWKFVNVEDENK
jgi:hypothetical protein